MERGLNLTNVLQGNFNPLFVFVKTMFQKILTKYLLLWLTLTCVLAFYWPNFGLPFDPFVNPKFSLGCFTVTAAETYIALTMLMFGSLLPVEELRNVARQWPKVIGGTGVQYLSMPLLAFLSACLFQLKGPYFIGLMLVGCVPGAMASNMLTMIARGNVSYSVGLTTSATFLSPLVVPLSLYLAIAVFGPFFGCTDMANQSYFNSAIVMNMAQTLLITVVSPVALGFCLARISSRWNRFARAFGEITANLVIILIIACAVAGNRGKEFPIFMIWPMLLVNFGGYAAGLLGGMLIKLDARKIRALIIEVGMQNAGLGVMLAGLYFPKLPKVALCCAMYTFGCMFTGIILVQFLRFLADRKEKMSDEI